MINRISAVAACICLLSLLSACGHQSGFKLPPTHGLQSLDNRVVAWIAGPATLTFRSGDKIGIPAGTEYALGDDALAYSRQSTGSYSTATGVVVRLGDVTVRIDNRPEGYVPETDYCHLDLERAKAGTQARIAKRNGENQAAEKKQAMGLWVMPPQYDKQTHELSYGRFVGTNARPGVNLFVAKFVRHGFYLFTWSGSQRDATTALKPGQIAPEIIAGVNPAANGAYEDHGADDSTAGYTVAGFWDTPETAAAYKDAPQDCD